MLPYGSMQAYVIYTGCCTKKQDGSLPLSRAGRGGKPFKQNRE